MNIKILSVCIAGLCLLASAAMAGPFNKGVINTLDLKTGNISIDYKTMRLTDKTRVRTAGGRNRDTGDLAVRQHVSYSANELGHITEIRIYDLHKLKQQGFYTDNELNH
jgi:hypothetical protein